MKYAGLHAEKRKILATLLSAGKSIITIDMAIDALSLDRKEARNMLSSFHRSGWLKLIVNGVYTPVSLESTDSTLSSENPLVLASYLFNPCYISGWSAASHWGLTDQLFNTYWIFTKQRVPKRTVTKGSHTYLLVHTSQEVFVGTTYEWFGSEKILIADPHQTVIDFLNNSDIFGTYGMVDIMKEYFHSSHADLSKLAHYAGLTKNKSIFKRLGFLLEYFKIDAPDIIEACALQISKGQSQLSSKTLGDMYLKKWHLYVPSNMAVQ